MRTSLLIALSLTACNPVVIPPGGDIDANVDAFRTDMGTLIVHDGGHDAFVGAIDSYIDSPIPDVGMSDGGVPSVLHLDGVFDEPIWTADPLNAMLTNATPILSPYDGDALTSLYVARDSDWLYFGFEGTITAGDAVVFYVDTQFEDTTGANLNGVGLDDMSNTVNAVLSYPILANPLFEPEWGWGTSVMAITPTPYSSLIGWRALATMGSFTPLTSNTTAICNGTACEVQTRLIALGVLPTGPIHLVVRLGRPGASGGWSNQTFPVSDAGSPEQISDALVSVVPPS